VVDPVSIVVPVVGIFAFFAGFACGRWRAAPEIAPPREVIRRKILETGHEEVDLECGHRILITRHRSGHYPCKECLDVANEKGAPKGATEA